MARQLQKTLVDYLVIAISPALIIALVGSLMFFLLEVFYQGNFQGRLQYIFALFVGGAVLIGRISIEEGRERAALFALPLGVVTLLAINKFVEFQAGVPSLLINGGLIALVWWSADKLTWDCTLIDEQEEDSGEGLLETVGLDRPDRASLQQEIAPSAEQEAPAHGNEDTLSDGVPSVNAASGWWARFVERRRRPHAPGVWVIYFSLAALPLFGIGQLFIPAGDLLARQYAFQILCVYTTSGLGLLLSTSFLGLRRYLRQRRQEMPLTMVNLWLGIGGVMIVGAMLSAMLLPRPNAEYAVSKLPFRLGSPDQRSSRYGTGREAVEEKQPWARGQQREGEPSGSAMSDQSGNALPADQRKSSDDSQGPATQKGRSPRAQPGNENQPGHDSSDADQSSPDRDKSKDTLPTETSQNSDKKATRSPDAQQKESPKTVAETPSQTNARGPDESQPLRAFPLMKVHPTAAELPMALVKWFLYGALALAAVFWLWRNFDKLLTGLSNFVQRLQDFWHSLFGGGDHRADTAEDEASSTRTAFRPFADFTDPFATGTAGRYPPEELVRYTFEALEAWARDQGHPRHPEQTPHEFTRSLVAHAAFLADDAGQLADLYCQVAYAPGTLPPTGVACLSHLWQNLTPR